MKRPVTTTFGYDTLGRRVTETSWVGTRTVGIRSLEKRIAEHEKKLEAFKAAPTVRLGMEGRSKEEIEAQHQARIRHEKEIQTFRENIRKLQEENYWSGKSSQMVVFLLHPSSRNSMISFWPRDSALSSLPTRNPTMRRF